jgi:NAD(P)-dependent dehydrogenase (short-subunit alcohol dehydrogenase family)
MKSVVVTGASTGIGWGCVKVLTGQGLRVFGSVRKQEDAGRLEREFGDKFVPLIFDVTDEKAVQAGAAKVAAALGNETLFGLVNNAGIAVPGPLLFLGIDEFRNQIEVNLTAQLIVTQAFAPLLMANRGQPGLPRRSSGGAKPGRIVMMSSIGGKNAFPFNGPYHASKYALEGMSESLRRELMVYGIDVILIRPGAVATPIWDKADTLDVSRFDNTPYAKSLVKLKQVAVAMGRKGYPPERIGRAVLKALTLRRPKTGYTENPNPTQEFIVGNFPKRLVDRIVAMQLGLKRLR